MCIYGVVNIDMVNSRKLSNRPKVQDDLKEYIKSANLDYRDYLLAPITVTLGDEWQIVLKDPSNSYKFIELFQKFLKNYEIDIYAGIGIGALSTDIYEDTRLMDGECFINAREALNIVKDNSRFYKELLYSNDNNVYFKGSEVSIHKLNFSMEVLYQKYSLDEVAVSKEANVPSGCFADAYDYMSEVSLNRIINSLIENTEVLKKKITKKQSEIIEIYQQEGSYSNIIKRRPEISKASISQKINASNYFLIRNNRFLIEKLLKLYYEIRKGKRNEI